MEPKTNVWKANLTNGLILALIGIVYSLVMYFLDLSLNKAQGYVFLLIQVVLLFFLVKSYRDNFMHGMITYGQAVGAGVVIIVYYSVIMAIFTYILYKFIDPGLVAKSLAQAEEAMRARPGISEEAVEAGMKFTAKLMKPGFMLIMGLVGGIFWGTILTLIISIFIKKEGNPLIDVPEN